MPEPDKSESPLTIHLPSTSHFWAAVALIAVAILAAALIHGWLSQRGIDRATVEQIIKDGLPQHQQNATDVQNAQQQAQQAAQREADNQRMLAATLASIAAQKAQPVQAVDYAKIDQMIASHMNVSPGQVTTHTDATTGQALTTLPTQAYRDYVLDCDATGLKLNSCQKTVGNKDVDIAARDSQIASISKDRDLYLKERDSAIKLANGGSFFRRLATGAKNSICGAGGATVGIATAAKADGKTGAIAGGGTFLFCEWLAHR